MNRLTPNVLSPSRSIGVAMSHLTANLRLPSPVLALARALDDEHPQVRRKTVHALSCENCKPNGCAVDVRPLFERAIGDESSLVRSMVIHVVTARFFHHQWAVDLVAGS